MHKDDIEKRLTSLLEEGSKVPADGESSTIAVPDYFDDEKFRLGQEVFEKNIFTMMIAKLSGLLVLLAVPSILDILRFTKQSGTPCAAFRRYAATILHTCIWYKSIPNRNIKFFESVSNVRRKHCIASRRCFEVGIGRISQRDMALTQFGFMGFSLLCAEPLGIVMSDKEADGLLHFWRVIGHMLGTDERFNLCNGSIDDTKALCRRLLEAVFMPNLAKNTKHFNEMSTALLKGLWPINPFIDVHAYKVMTYHLISTAVSYNNNSLTFSEEPMPTYSRLILNFQLFVHQYLLQTRFWWSGLFRAFFNSQMRMGIYLTEKFPFLAYWIFGRRQSYFNIYKFHLE
ncbi:uncharacterized protein LOC107043162 [Diachasma alloeum]|uniref:uncharacterized protein LOC107043162 n=1 Tax=Diachasma alloeum TaxID=454923 RepID=UPI00073838AF|nr:uncharacterized protein LOC107043162 [Diachasma alloeum]